MWQQQAADDGSLQYEC